MKAVEYKLKEDKAVVQILEIFCQSCSKKIVFLAMWTFFTMQGKAQDTSLTHPAFVQFSVLYDFPQSYGFTVGIDRPFVSVLKMNNGATKKQKDFFVSLNAGCFRYPFNYTGILVLPSAGIRYFKKKHYYSELAISMGILRTFYDGTVYHVDNNGTVSQLPLFGRNYALTGISYAADWQIKKRNSGFWTVQLKPVLWMQYPYDSFIKLHFSVEAGIKYAYKKRPVPTRIKTKMSK